jgi:phosphoribosylanthranilate isomerase
VNEEDRSRVWVKICGITNEDDALLATALDADALGFVFAPSKRQVDTETVRDILRRLPREVHTVGVFKNEKPERIMEIVGRTGLHGVQLHGREPRSEVEWLHERVQFLIQAFAAGDAALADAGRSPADVILVDSPAPGSGKVFDWRLAEGAPSGIRLVIAGGLTAENVGDSIRLVRPWGVDVSTGVEEKPGKKDATRLRLFVAAAREAGAEIADRSIDPARDDVGGVDRPWDWQLDE